MFRIPMKAVAACSFAWTWQGFVSLHSVRSQGVLLLLGFCRFADDDKEPGLGLLELELEHNKKSRFNFVELETIWLG